MEAELKRYVAENGMQDVVEFTGFVSEEDKPRYYASADIAAFPSSGGESFGIVLLEAMASGKAAVLAGNNPGYASVMAPQPSLLFDPQDAAALAEKLKALLLSEQERKTAAAWGSVYTAGFDIHKVGKQLIEIYKQALHQRRNLP
jgi:phosphatidyl-myo-inositol alpha-mannosyltransferase